MANNNNKQNKKRSIDVLASLDAVFSSNKKVIPSKYTSHEAAQAIHIENQQIYKGLKRNRKKKDNANVGSESNPNKKQKNNKSNTAGKQVTEVNTSVETDPVYEKLPVELLSVGLKGCTLNGSAKKRDKSNCMNETLQQYLEKVLVVNSSDAPNMTKKLRRTVIQVDNPMRASSTAKRISPHWQSQHSNRLGSRKQRIKGLNLIKQEDISWDAAEKLSIGWLQFAREALYAQFDTGNRQTSSARLQSKFRRMEILGCPVQVIRSGNAKMAGVKGVIITETKHMIQLCTNNTGELQILPKKQLCFQITLDENSSFTVDGKWLADRWEITHPKI